MNLCRSEEHVERWLNGRDARRDDPRREVAELAQAWWSDRLAPDWRPHTRDQNQAILAGSASPVRSGSCPELASGSTGRPAACQASKPPDHVARLAEAEAGSCAAARLEE